MPVKQDAVGEFRPAMLILLGATALLLLTVFANAGNLQLVRATSRVREMALRATLGASRARLMKQLVTESLVITIAGGNSAASDWPTSSCERSAPRFRTGRHGEGLFFLPR